MGSTRTRQWIQTAILLLLGIYLLETRLTGEIAFYINERFNWLAVLGGVLFLAMGIVRLVSLVRETPAHEHEHEHGPDHDHDHHHEHAHAHEHNHGAVSWPVLALVAFPLAIGILLPAKPLGAAAIGNGGVTTALSPVAGTFNAKQFAAAPLERNILDWVRAFYASSTPDEFTGQPADVTGFVYRDIRFDNHVQFMVARFTVSCCVADAQAIGVIIESPSAVEFTQDNWVRVKGKFQVRDFDGHRTPVLIAESIEKVAMPERPYLYP